MRRCRLCFCFLGYGLVTDKEHQVAARITGDKPLFEVNVEKNVADILDEGAVGVSSKDIDAVIFSHHHWVGTEYQVIMASISTC